MTTLKSLEDMTKYPSLKCRPDCKFAEKHVKITSGIMMTLIEAGDPIVDAYDFAVEALKNKCVHGIDHEL